MKEMSLSFLCFLALLFFLQFSALHLLPYWDELGFYIPYAYTLFKNNFLLNLEYTNIQITHPPLYYFLIAIITKLSGWSIILIRIIAIITSAFFCTGVYAVSRIHAGKMISHFATIAFIFSPLFFSESILVHADLPMATLLIWALFACFKNKILISAILFAAAALCNATVIVLYPAFMIYLLYDSIKNKNFLALRKTSLQFSLPVFLAMVGWILWSFSIQGITLGGDPDPGHSERFFHHGILPVIHRFFYRSMQIFILDFRFLLLLPIIAYFLKIKMFQISLLAREEKILLLIYILEITFLSAFGVLLQRYFLVIHPILFIVAAWYLQKWILYNKKYLIVAIFYLLVISGLEYYSWQSPPSRYSFFHYRSAYRDQVQLLEDAVKLLERELDHKQSTKLQILAPWPLSSAVSKPFLGFTKKDLPITAIPYLLENKTILEWKQKEKNSHFILASIVNLQNLEHLSITGENFTKIQKEFSLFNCTPTTKGIWQLIICK